MPTFKHFSAILDDNTYEGHNHAIRGLRKEIAKSVVKTVAKQAGKAIVKGGQKDKRMNQR